MKGIKYVASFKDYSGYASSARKNALAIKKHIPICGLNVSFAPNESLIEPEEIFEINGILGSQIEYDVVLQHLTPENYPRFMEDGKFNVGLTTWEASKLHPVWINPLNKMNLVLVPCEWNKKVFEESGITVPIEVYPHAFNTSMFDNVQPHPMLEKYKNKLKFYSIFQWSERKNPTGLIRTYLSSFDASDDVVLIIKTYAGSGSDLDRRWLADEIQKITSSVNKSNPPEIVLIMNLTTEDKILQLHRGCDVYLAPIRGEGFGIPIFEAALAGNHVIATNYGGHLDFMKNSVSDLLPYQLTPIVGMPHIKWYLADMFWADPDLSVFRRKMQDYYRAWTTYRAVAAEETRRHSDFLRRTYGYEAVTSNLLNMLKAYL